MISHGHLFVHIEDFSGCPVLQTWHQTAVSFQSLSMPGSLYRFIFSPISYQLFLWLLRITPWVWSPANLWIRASSVVDWFSLNILWPSSPSSWQSGLWLNVASVLSQKICRICLRVSGLLFGPAAKKALERRMEISDSRTQHNQIHWPHGALDLPCLYRFQHPPCPGYRSFLWGTSQPEILVIGHQWHLPSGSWLQCCRDTNQFCNMPTMYPGLTGWSI